MFFLEASAAGGLFALSVMAAMTLSETEAVPSETVRVNSTVAVVPETLGAVNLMSGTESLASVMESVKLCVHV